MGVYHQLVVGKNGLELHAPGVEFLKMDGVETVYTFFEKLVADHHLL